HREGPATAHHMGGMLAWSFGSIDPATEPLVQALYEALADTPIKAKIHPDILSDVWENAMMVTCFGALGAVLEKPIGVLRTEYRDSLRALMVEAAATAKAAGIELKDGTVDKVMSFVDQQAEGATSSMQRDILEGLHSELDSQVGGIVRIAISSVLLHRCTNWCGRHCRRKVQSSAGKITPAEHNHLEKLELNPVRF